MIVDNAGMFKPGTRFRGNVNGAEMEVVKIEKSNKDFCESKTAIIRDIKTGNCFPYGLRALEKCDVTITREGFVYGLDGTVYVQDDDRQGWTGK